MQYGCAVPSSPPVQGSRRLAGPPRPQRLIINWTSPTGHTYQRRPRQTTPPEAWIRTGGTSIAEHLDRIAELRTQPAPTVAATLTRCLADLEPDTESDEVDTRPEPDTSLDPDTSRKPATHEDPDTPTTSTTSEPAGTNPTTDTEPAPAEPAEPPGRPATPTAPPTPTPPPRPLPAPIRASPTYPACSKTTSPTPCYGTPSTTPPRSNTNPAPSPKTTHRHSEPELGVACAQISDQPIPLACGYASALSPRPPGLLNAKTVMLDPISPTPMELSCAWITHAVHRLALIRSPVGAAAGNAPD